MHDNNPIALLPGLLLLTMLMGCIDPGLSPRAPTPGVPHVTIQSFNIHNETYEDRATIEAVGAADADIIALQEVGPEWEPVLRERYNTTYPFQLYHTDPGSGPSGGLAVLSRHPLEDLGVLPGLDDWHPAWHVNVDSPAGTIQLLVVHLRAPFTRRETTFDIGEAHTEEIATFSRRCDETISTVVLGDFNESTGGDAVQYLEGRGFTNLLPLFRPGQETWSYERSFMGQMVDTIDHILIDGSMRPLNAYVLYEGNSDHLPVVAVVERRGVDTVDTIASSQP